MKAGMGLALSVCSGPLPGSAALLGPDALRSNPDQLRSGYRLGFARGFPSVFLFALRREGLVPESAGGGARTPRLILRAHDRALGFAAVLFLFSPALSLCHSEVPRAFAASIIGSVVIAWSALWTLSEKEAA